VTPAVVRLRERCARFSIARVFAWVEKRAALPWWDDEQGRAYWLDPRAFFLLRAVRWRRGAPRVPRGYRVAFATDFRRAEVLAPWWLAFPLRALRWWERRRWALEELLFDLGVMSVRTARGWDGEGCFFHQLVFAPPLDVWEDRLRLQPWWPCHLLAPGWRGVVRRVMRWAVDERRRYRASMDAQGPAKRWA
jgi:hypothetical protein